MLKSKQRRAVVYGEKVGKFTRLPVQKTKLRAIRKSKWVCEGGPMHRETLMLTTSHTLPFTLNGQTGRYKNGKWETLQ